MDTANVMVALGGDKGNTVPKWGVSAAEIAVLRVIHGDESVFDIEPLGTKKMSHRAERERLFETYGHMEGERRVAPAVEALFPGVAAVLIERIADLDLPEEFFKAERRVSAPLAEEAPAENEPVDLLGDPVLEHAETEEAEIDDGIGEIRDGVGGGNGAAVDEGEGLFD